MKKFIVFAVCSIFVVPVALAQEQGGGISNAIEKRQQRIEQFKEDHPGAAQVVEKRREKLEDFKEKHLQGEGKGKELIEEYDNYYDRDKFDSLAGEDGSLTEEDWVNNRTKKEGRAFGDERWKRAMKFDADGDGALSLEEAKAYKRAEKRKLINYGKELPSPGPTEGPGAGFYGREGVPPDPGVASQPVRGERWRDVREDIRDRREDVRDHREDVWDRREDVRDRREDVRDRREDVRDRREDFRDRGPLKDRPRPQAVEGAIRKHPKAAGQLYEDGKKHPGVAGELLRDGMEHPVAAEKVYRAADKHPGAAKQLYKDGKKHPGAAKKLYKDGKKHPGVAKKAYRAAENHPHAAKKAYQAGKNHPGTSKKAYQAGKKHSGAAKKAVRNPGKAKNAAKHRR